MSVARNAPCPCGSGRKHKNCCANKVPWYKESGWTAAFVGLILLGGALLIGALVFRSGDETVPGRSGQVWSEEHGHWHDAP